MRSELSNALKQSKCSIDDIFQAVETDGDLSEVKLTQKASKRLISILKDELDMQNEEEKVLFVLESIYPNINLINQIVACGPELSSICDKLLSDAISSKHGTELDQKSLSVIFNLVNRSDKLKSQLCMSIQEYILTSIDHKTINPQLLPIAMEILVCAVTHHQENRTFFIKNTPKEKIDAVFHLSQSTGNTMVQIFCAEFLWRVAIPMRLNQEEKDKIFGKYAESLYSITVNSFRQGIFNFINEINNDRKDSNRIIQIPIKNVILGNSQIDGKHNLYLGNDSIVLCINKSNVLSELGPNSELITLKKSDIAGIGISEDDYLCIGINEDFDTLPELFEQMNKTIFFRTKSNDFLNPAQQRFGKITAPSVPIPKPIKMNRKAQTPKPKSDMPTKKMKKKSQTPKSAQFNPKRKEKPKTNKTKIETPSKSTVKNTVRFSEQIKDTKKQKKQVKQIKESSSDESDIEEIPSNKSIQIEHQTKIKNERQNSIQIEHNEKPLKDEKLVKYQQQIENDESENEMPNADDMIPPVKISGSYIDDSDDAFDTTSGPESPQANDISSKNEIKIEPLPTTISNENEQNFSTKPIVYKTKRREYTPERWELETFDELKNFSQAIRSRLSERHLMLNRAIDDTVSQSLKEISDFMAKCDEDMMQLRNDFDSSSTQIAQDIDQKQKMVAELGDQQSEHIIQMLHDCELLQKRAKELVKRFAQQKKTLLANQEKHIALFREDMRSEVKAAVTTKKRESSKKLVQKLVNLLDEL